MGYTLQQLAQNCLGVLSLPIFFLAPGYVLASCSNLLGFRRLWWAERILWSLVLSTPFAVLLSVHPALQLSPRAIQYSFLALALLALALWLHDRRTAAPQQQHLQQQHLKQPDPSHQTTTSPTRCCLIAATLLAAFCILAPLGITVGHRLFENTVWQDWDIRIQLVNACIRGGASPVNPMYAVQGQTAAMHYYFYWYVLCAQIAQLTGIGARAALTASCAGAALTLLASLLLAVKYLRISNRPLRRLAVATIVAASVIGLDLITVAIDLFTHRLRPDPQHAIMDHAPGLINMCLWSPHHVAGAASCLAGLLLVVTALGKRWPQCLLHALLAGVCFAAAAGTSTFLTAVFALACAAVFLNAARRREATVAATLAAAGLVALLLTLPFLHQLAATAQASPPQAAPQTTGTAANHLPLHLTLRYSNEGHTLVNRYLYGRKPAPATSSLPLLLLRLPVILALFVIDFGFAIFVVIDRIRRDWPARKHLPPSSQLLWTIFLAAALPGFLLSSASAFHAENDLAFHTGIVMRMVIALWAAPLLLEFVEQRKHNKTVSGWSPLWQRVAVAAFLLGISSVAAQLFIGRFGVPLVNAGLVRPYVVAERVPHPAARFYDIHLAMDAAAAHAPPNGIVQGYPHSRLAPILLLYTHRQMSASDDGCNVPFGGQIQRCKTASTSLDQLFGGTPHFHGASSILPDIPLDTSRMTAANFQHECSDQHLSVLIADYTSPAWRTPGSWVWTLQPVFANRTARVFVCPTAAT